MRQIARISTGLLGVLSAATGGISVSSIFEGAVKEELDYHKLMSRIALQTHGLSDTSASIRDNFRSAGDRLQTVAQTGQKIGKWMKGMVTLQQRGLKNQKFNNKLMKSALNMSTMTGVEAEFAGEQYADWGQHFHMSNFELASMNVAMKDIVRQTGLTGSNLQEAMKAAQGLQRQMKASGVATRDMLESSIRITAIAQKKGIGDVAGTYTDALSGGFDKFSELPGNIKGALMRFGNGDSQLMEDIMAGRGMQEKNLRKIAEGMKMDTRSVLGLDLMTADLTKIDSTRMKSLQIMAQKIYGMGIGDLQKMVQTMDEGSRTIQERTQQAEKKAAKDIAALDKQRASGLITEEQHSKMLADRNAQLATQVSDLRLTDINKQLNDVLGDGAKAGGAAFTDALVKAGDGDIDAGIQKVQEGFLESAMSAQQTVQAAYDSGTMTKDAFDTAMSGFDAKGMTAELSDAMASGDTSKVAELQQKLVDMQQTGDAQKQKSTNVVDKIQTQVEQINAKLRDMFSDGLIGILEKLGAVAIIITMLAASVVTAIAGLGVILTTMLGPTAIANMGAAIGGRLAKPIAGIKGVLKGAKGRLAKPIAGVKGVIKGAKGKLGGRVGGMAVTRGGLGNAASRAKGVARGRVQMLTGVSEFKQATQGMRTSVAKFATNVKTSVKNSKAWTKASGLIQDASKSLAKRKAALKRPLAKAIGRSKTVARHVAGRATSTATSVATRVTGAASRGVQAVKGSKAGLKIASMSAKAGKGLATTSRLMKGVGKAGITAARGLGTTLKAVGSWTVVLPIAISAIEGFAGAMMAGAKAHEIFDVQQGKVTERMRMAAEGAGIFTGMLNGISFGLFEKWLGPTGSVTVGLAHFMKAVWPLAVALQMVLLPFKVLWGVIKGLYLFLKNAFIGLWEGLKLAVQPVIDVFEVLWDAVSEIGSVFTDLFESFGMFGDTGSGLPSTIDVISGALGALGTALGWVFKAVGLVIKMSLMPLVWAIKWLVKPIVGLIKIALWPLIQGIKIIAKAFVWLYDAMVKPVINAVKDIFKWFNDLYMWLVGGSIVPDMIMGIFKWFAKLPGLIFKAIWKIPKMIINALLSVGGAIGRMFIKLPKLVWGGIKKIWKGLKGLGKLFWETLKELPGIIWEAVKGLGIMIWNSIKGLGRMVWQMISKFPALIASAMASAAVGIAKAAGYIPKTIIQGVLSIPKKVATVFSDIASWFGLDGVAEYFGKIGDVFGSLIDIVGGIFTFDFDMISEGFSNLGTAIWDAIKAIPGYLYDVFIGIPQLIFNSIWTGIKWVGEKIWGGLSWIWEKISGLGGLLWDTIKKLPSMIWDGIKGIGEALLGGLEAVFVTFPTWLFDTIVGGLADLGTWIWDNTIGAMINMIPAWIKNMFGGAAADAGKGVSETSEEQSKTWEKEGASVAHGAGGMVGGVKEVLSGNVMEGGGKILKGAGETVVGVAKGAKDLAVGAAKAVGGAISSVASKLNPFNWFEEGTRKIEKTGLGVLHEGEAVIPADAIEGMKAEGNGPFGEMGGGIGKVMDAFNPMTWFSDGPGPMEGIGKSIGGMVGKLFGGGKKSKSSIGGVKQGSNESNRMKEFYADLAFSNKDIANINKQILDYLTKGPQSGAEEVTAAATEAATKTATESASGKTKEDGGFFSTLFGGLKERVGGVVDAIKESPVGKAVGKMIDTVKESPVGKAVGKMIGVWKDSPVGKVGSAIGGGVMDAASWFGDKALGTGDWLADAFGFGSSDAEGALDTMDMLNPFSWFGKEGEVTVPDKSTGETRTMSAEESAEARLTRHKVEGQPQQVMTHGTDTASLEAVGLDQLSVLSQIRDGINKLSSAFDVSGPAPTERIGGGNDPGQGDSATRYTGNAAALDFGASPYSSGNEPGMQQVVSQGGVGE